jgi:hypothetical protein
VEVTVGLWLKVAVGVEVLVTVGVDVAVRVGVIVGFCGEYQTSSNNDPAITHI